MPGLRLTTAICAPVAACFELSLSVEAHTSSMSGSGEKIVGGVRQGSMRLGDTVTFRARHFGIPWRLTSEITEYEAPHAFVDEQRRGPFAQWHHRHTFETTAEGTLMTDEVLMRSPLGPIGALVDRWVLVRYLTQVLRQRNTWLAAELERRRVTPFPLENSPPAGGISPAGAQIASGSTDPRRERTQGGPRDQASMTIGTTMGLRR